MYIQKREKRKCWRCSMKGHLKKDCDFFWKSISKEELQKIIVTIKYKSFMDINIYPFSEQHNYNNNGGFHYCIMDYVGNNEKLVFRRTGYIYRNIRIYDDDETNFFNLVKLINTPHILSVILRYNPKFLEKNIFIISSWKRKYSDNAFLLQFVTNKRCCELHYLHINYIYEYINHIASNKIGNKDISYLISKFL